MSRDMQDRGLRCRGGVDFSEHDRGDMPARSDPRTEKSRKSTAATLRSVPKTPGKQKAAGKGAKAPVSLAKSAKNRPGKVAVLSPSKPAKLKVTFTNAPKPNGSHPSKGVLRKAGQRRLASAAFTSPPRTASSTKSDESAPVANGSSDGKAKSSSIAGVSAYHPSETEPFMNERQRSYFRNKLIAWKEDIVRQNQETLTGLHEDSAQFADVADRATSETDRALELRARDRQRKLMSKIDAALSRLDDGSYGYCEETGEPISLKRLDARPIATMSLEAQERKERMERVFRED